jgi:hypothetical protein
MAVVQLRTGDGHFTNMETTTETPSGSQPQSPTPVAAPAKVYFYKEIASSRFVANGAPVDFELLDGNRGVIALTPGQDDATISALNKNQGRYGIVKINAEEYELKKNLYPYQQSRPKKEMLRMMRPVQPLRPARPGGDTAAGDSQPMPGAPLPPPKPPRPLQAAEEIPAKPVTVSSQPQIPPIAPAAPRPATRRVGGRIIQGEEQGGNTE